MKRLVTSSVRFYKRHISYMLGPCCRFYPSCSEYTILAIDKYGLFFGVLKSTWRILRCNPLARGGLDLP